MTSQERTDLDKVLRTGLRIFWGQENISFEQCIFDSELKIFTTNKRPKSKKKIEKTAKHGKFSKWFSLQQDQSQGKNISHLRAEPRRTKGLLTTLIFNNLPDQTWDTIRR